MSVADKIKRCPSCLVLTPPDKQVKRVSRSSGKTTITMRCLACDAKSKLKQKLK